MTPEHEIHPQTIRQVATKSPEKYQHYVKFFARIGNVFYKYNPSGNNTSNTFGGPQLEMGEGIFIETGKGQWEKTQIGCSGLIKFCISPTAKIYSKEEFEQKETRKKEELEEFLRHK